MSLNGSPVGNRPVKVALLMVTGAVRLKSSADSISAFPGLPGRDPVAIRPSGFPVLKVNVCAEADTARHNRVARVLSPSPK